MAKETVIRPQMPAGKAAAFTARVQTPDPFTLVIFGGSGDLARRKLLPALFGLWRGGLLPRDCLIVGLARRQKSDDEYRQLVKEALAEFRPEALKSDQLDDFLNRCYYQAADLNDPEKLNPLVNRLSKLEKEKNLPGNRLYYLSVDPKFFAPIIEGLAETGMVRREEEQPWARVIIEKPFGHDLDSARKLDRQVRRYLRGDQIYRIDHFLGKETVQNLMAFRFGNAIFEPLFSRQYVDHVQITMTETIGMEGRGDFYDSTGALRDVMQNHMLQLLGLVAMDAPATLRAGDLSDAKLKVFRSLTPLRGEAVSKWVVRGQYGPGKINGEPVPGYREEKDVAPDSTTETYVALRAQVENWRWAGVPFLLRTGKRLATTATEIAVQFKLPPLRLFQTVECEGDECDLTETRPSVLIFRIQPNEGISLSFSTKRPGMQLVLQPVHFEFDYEDNFPQELPQAYERLLLDALRGDSSLYTRSDELEAAWEFMTPILQAWQEEKAPSLPTYAAGSLGPAEADRLTQDCCSGWRKP